MVSKYIKLIRPWQWYKNLIVLLPLIFAVRLLDIESLIISLISFVLFCLASSGNYILNDIIDAPRDRLNPEKKHRPIASGSVKPGKAFIIALALYAIALAVSMLISTYLTLVILSFIALTNLYSLFLKNELFADITVIGINFVLRAIGGVFAINVALSPWLIVSVFFLAVFLASSKRYSEVMMFGYKAIKHRDVLQHYTKDLSQSLLNISTSILLVSYAFYSFQSSHQGLVYSMPIAFYAVLRYHYLVRQNSKIARHPELFVKDYRLLVSALLWGIAVFIALYANPISRLIATLL